MISLSLFMYRILNILLKLRFCYTGVTWNELPQHIQSVLNINQFKCNVKRFLFSYLNDQDASSFWFLSFICSQYLSHFICIIVVLTLLHFSYYVNVCHLISCTLSVYFSGTNMETRPCTSGFNPAI